MSQRSLSPLDRALIDFDQAMRTLFGRPRVTERPNPSEGRREAELSDTERDHLARLMRINHSGEVCAQALYQGQALTARDARVRDALQRSSAEENDHLDWCATRVGELGGRLSLLNPLWYAGSFCIGAAAGLAGDRWSLGFVAETERQVEAHLEGHLAQVQDDDDRTRAILQQMKADEIVHGATAKALGGAELPGPVAALMRLSARIMTGSVYYL
jgi:ubiquinone biosynthesis monooxygenase Coq7